MGSDESPYNCISSCALDPIFISIAHLPSIQDHECEKIIKNLQALNNEKRVDYKKVRRLKNRWLYLYFKKKFPEIEKKKRFQIFVRQNPWIDDYAAFLFLRFIYKDRNWKTWPKKYRDINKKTKLELLHAHEEDLKFTYFLQYLCFTQLEQVKDYAEKKNILMKGDIPILVSPNSADVWYDRKNFDFTHVAGTPPDEFNQWGQKWNFPLFNWEYIEKTDYAWWKRRLNVASSYYHIYRVDHVVGFFRIWSILPKDNPMLGKFLPKDPKKWPLNGKKRLSKFLEISTMLPLAEDLGLIPNFVYTTLKDLGICGTKIMRWQLNQEIHHYEPISMTSLSTHDLPLTEDWWKNSIEAKAYAKRKNWKYSPVLTFEQKKEILWESHHTASLFHVNLLPEYFSLFPDLVWPNPEDQRINMPGTLSNKNWTYRFKQYLEEIIIHKDLKKAIQEIIS